MGLEQEPKDAKSILHSNGNPASPENVNVATSLFVSAGGEDPNEILGAEVSTNQLNDAIVVLPAIS